MLLFKIKVQKLNPRSPLSFFFSNMFQHCFLSMILLDNI
jgi:hypothetical protein